LQSPSLVVAGSAPGNPRVEANFTNHVHAVNQNHTVSFI
jgi:hypothetical protein